MRKQNDPKPTKKRYKDKSISSEGLRIPRPLGLTLLAHQTKKQQPTEQEIEQLLNYLIKYKLQVNNQPLTISTLSTYLNIPSYRVMKTWLSYQGKISKVMLGNMDQIRGALIFFGLNNALEDKAMASNQLQLLQASQQGRYQAYISSAVNEALNINISATKSLMDIFKALTPNSHTLIQNNIGTEQPNSAIKAIGTQEAINLLHKEGLTTLSYNPNPTIVNAYSLDKAPEVRAKFMNASSTDGMSLLVAPGSKAQGIEDIGPEPTNPKSHHITRREEEEGLDVEDFLGDSAN